MVDAVGQDEKVGRVGDATEEEWVASTSLGECLDASRTEAEEGNEIGRSRHWWQSRD